MAQAPVSQNVKRKKPPVIDEETKRIDNLKKKENPQGLSTEELNKRPLDPSPQAIQGGALPNPNDPNRTIQSTSPETIAQVNQQLSTKATQQQQVAGTQTPDRSLAIQALEETGFFESPQIAERTELDIEGIPSTPILGPITKAVKSILINRAKRLGRPYEDTEMDTLIQNPISARELQLQEIQQQVIDDGISRGEEIGGIIESIPVAGSVVSKYARGMIETPSGNVATIRQTINGYGADATNIGEKVFSGKINPMVGIEQLNEMEEDIARMEQRLKLLSITSPILIADADTMNSIESDIQDAKQRIINNRQLAGQGALKEAPTEALAIDLIRSERRD